VDVGPTEIKVNQADLFSGFCQKHGQIGYDHGLAGSAFTRSYGNCYCHFVLKITGRLD
jgi:hypothetical protein